MRTQSPGCLATCPAVIGGECECGGSKQAFDYHQSTQNLLATYGPPPRQCPEVYACALCNDARGPTDADMPTPQEFFAWCEANDHVIEPWDRVRVGTLLTGGTHHSPRSSGRARLSDIIKKFMEDRK